MNSVKSSKLRGLRQKAVRRLKLDLLRSFASGFPRALCQEAKLITKHILQDYRNRHNAPKEVLLANLRTASHMLDKGLSCFSWEAGRGVSAYQRSLDLIGKIGDDPKITNDPSYLWAMERLREYETAQESEKLDVALQQPQQISPQERDSYIEFIRSRRSTRHFRREKIPRELLEKISASVHWAPCSCCRQPVVLHITQQDNLVEECLRQCAGATGFSGYVPCFISVCADTRFYQTIDRSLPLIDASLGAQSYMLTAYAHGLSCTALNWMHATKEERKTLRQILSIAPHERIVFNLAIGYPETLPRQPGYKGLEATCVIV